MLALLTSCNRHDLLKQTVDSLFLNQKSKIDLIVNEDSAQVVVGHKTIYTPSIGQYRVIETFINSSKDKYYLHLEDDWLFDNSYDWIKKSIEILKNNPDVIKVICRADAEHPCDFNADGWGYLEPWNDPWKNNLWHGFGWNPGVTRMDLLREIAPFSKTEQQTSKRVYDAGYKTVLLEKGVCTHIGFERSTHLP